MARRTASAAPCPKPFLRHSAECPFDYAPRGGPHLRKRQGRGKPLGIIVVRVAYHRLGEARLVLEQAGIMEYNSGLDRQTAVLEAVALYFPIDYQNMIERVKAYPDGKTIIHEFLEKLLSSSPAWDTTTTNINRPGHDAWQKKTIDLPERYEGMAALEYMTAQGIHLIGAYESGAMIAKQEPENFTKDPTEVTALIEGRGDRQGRARGTRIERFYFIPKDAGLICLDIDRKPGKVDGLLELYKVFPKDILPLL